MTCEFKAASHASTRAKALQLNGTVFPEASSLEKNDIPQLGLS